MGKTTVSDYLAMVHHLPVLDADLFAREAVEPGTIAMSAIEARYGAGVVLPDGSLNRSRLGEIIFPSPAERLWLEQCIHPYVRDHLEQAIHTPPLNDVEHHPILVLVIPLLFEARMTDLVTETWLVTTPPERQLELLMKRDRLSLEQAQARINSQMAIEKKIARADVVLCNSAKISDLLQQVNDHLLKQPQQVTTHQN